MKKIVNQIKSKVASILLVCLLLAITTPQLQAYDEWGCDVTFDECSDEAVWDFAICDGLVGLGCFFAGPAWLGCFGVGSAICLANDMHDHGICEDDWWDCVDEYIAW